MNARLEQLDFEQRFKEPDFQEKAGNNSEVQRKGAELRESTNEITAIIIVIIRDQIEELVAKDIKRARGEKLTAEVVKDVEAQTNQLIGATRDDIRLTYFAEEVAKEYEIQDEDTIQRILLLCKAIYKAILIVASEELADLREVKEREEETAVANDDIENLALAA